MPMPSAVMGAEDWSYVLQKIPGCMTFLGVAPPGCDFHTAAPCPPWLKRAWIDLIGGEKVREGFGSSEAVGMKGIEFWDMGCKLPGTFS